MNWKPYLVWYIANPIANPFKIATQVVAVLHYAETGRKSPMGKLPQPSIILEFI